MDWDKYMEALNQEQDFLEKLVGALKAQLKEGDPPLSPLFSTILSHGTNLHPGGIAVVIGNREALPQLLPIVIAVRQIEFNKTVISMLTDLDYRKSEPREGT